MADHLSEQVTWMLRTAQFTDEASSWVMIRRDGQIVPIEDEKIHLTSRSRVGFELTTPKELNVAEPFNIKSDSGLAYITNHRVIYLPAHQTDKFRSFFAPILNFSDTHTQSAWIGPWSWSGTVKPVPGGGIPMNIPRVEVKFIFKDGGHHDFQTKFEFLKERLSYVREMGLQNPGPNLEPPPPYEPSAEPENAGGSGASAVGGSSTSTAEQQRYSPPQPAPDEPPPDYVEAQTQAISMQYEERMREEADRR